MNQAKGFSHGNETTWGVAYVTQIIGKPSLLMVPDEKQNSITYAFNPINIVLFYSWIINEQLHLQMHN